MSFRLPSTPNSRSLQSQPSTTPAGPPPTWLTDKSTTPNGPPPRMNFNSSYNPSDNTFGSQRGYTAPNFEDDGDYDDDEDDDMDAEEDGDMPALPRPNAFLSSMAASRSSPRGLKRSRDGKARGEGEFGAIATGIVGRSKPAPLKEDDEVILSIERFTASLNNAARTQNNLTVDGLSDRCATLSELLARESDATTKSGMLGPASEDPFTKANYLASLLLQLHCPHSTTKSRLQAQTTRKKDSSRSERGVPIPEALLRWLNTYHLPFPDDFDSVHLYRPSPSAHESFWDLVFASAMRGKLDRVIRLLRDAGWQNAYTAADDGATEEGYTGSQLQATEDVTAYAADVIASCPAVQYADWDVTSSGWTAFRQRVKLGLDKLTSFAESDLDQSRSERNMFEQSANESIMSMSTASRRAESRVPWTIYENLSLLYKLLLGSIDDVLLTSQDWLEAALYLTIWWDGSDDTAHDAALSKSTHHRNATQKPREVDVSPLSAYRSRLSDAFTKVTADPDENVFAVNTMDIVEVGLACIMEESVSSVISILRTLSMPIATSMVELASIGGWLPLARSQSRGHLLGQGFSEEDLLVLSHGPRKQSSQELSRDQLFGEYADLLAQKSKIHNKEGWELAVAVLSRQDDSIKSAKQMTTLLDRVPLAGADSVDKVLAVCDDFGLATQRADIAERFADGLAENEAQQYGAMLYYYARAHAVEKVRRTLELLTSLCLLHSAPLPTAETIDAKLESLLSRDRPALRELAGIDLEAATLLSSQFSGYATLRRFYELRDQDVQGVKAYSRDSRLLKPLERRRQAANALFGVIKSSADCIPGGLFDREAESVVSVEGLLVLFGEALPLLGQSQRNFTESQIFALLGIVEDYAAAPARVHENANSLLSASLTAYQENSTANPAGNKKSTSDLSASSSWDMIASRSIMLNGQNGETRLRLNRAWDLRRGLVELYGITAGDAQVVALLRDALAREVASGWGGLLNW